MPGKPRGKPFAKGKSGNPGGRPKEVGDIRELARAHTPMAIATLAEIAAGGRSEMARIAASDSLLDRGYGRPTQMLANDPENPFPAGVQFYMPANHRERETPTETTAAVNGARNGKNGSH
jgi:hypothetical protein